MCRGDGCWEWSGYRNERGYGFTRVGGRGSRGVLAHRLSYMVNVGEIPDGLHVLHRCDNPACVRPDHLFLGTNLDNIRDRMAKGRPGSQAFKNKPSPNRRLSDEQAAQLAAKFSAGTKPALLAVEFGVTREHAWRIGTGRVRSAQC